MDPVTSSAPSTATSSATALPPPFPAAGGSSLPPIGAGLLLAVLATAALFAARRRKRTARLVEIVETSSLGPKRSLVVARVGDELLLLGSSEGGIALLTTRPASPRSAEAAAPATAASSAPAHDGESTIAASRFELLLGESADDVELRRKLAAGSAGSVR